MQSFGVFAAAFVFTVLAASCRSEDPSAATPAREAMRAHVDEEGNFVPPPPATPALEGKRSVEEKIPDWESAPGGGEMIRLDGALRKHAE